VVKNIRKIRTFEKIMLYAIALMMVA